MAKRPSKKNADLMNKLLLSAAIFFACSSRPPLNVDGIFSPAPVVARLQGDTVFYPMQFFKTGEVVISAGDVALKSLFDVAGLASTPAGIFTLTVRAYADTARSIQPRMVVRMGQVDIATVRVRRAVDDYVFSNVTAGDTLRIILADDYYDPLTGEDVNIHVLKVTFSPNDAGAQLVWDANTEEDLLGYNIYQGLSSRVYGAPQNVGFSTTYPLGYLDGKTRYFSVTAFDTAGNESDYSNEVIWTAPTPADTVEPEPDSTLVEWPDNKPLRMRIIYQKHDATGKPLVPVIRLEMEKYDAGNSYGWFQKFPGADFTLTAADDTTSIIEMNMPALASSIARQGDEYLWNIRFRIRLENPADQAKVTPWVYADKALHLFQAVNPLEGVPVAPTFKIIL